MNFRAWKKLFLTLCIFTVGAQWCPAPFIYTPGEGWVYENPGDDSGWRADRAQDQLEITQLAIEAGDGKLALRSAKRLLSEWPLSDFAPEAQFLAGEAYVLRKMDQKAFEEFQNLIDFYPKSPRYEEALKHQFDIAARFMQGQRKRILWGHVPFTRSMKTAISMFEQVIKNGPYTEFAAQAQINIGMAHERRKGFLLSFSEKYTEAATAYEQAAFRYFDRPEVAADALFLAGNAYFRQARTGEYDQGHSQKAITAYEDFMAMFPADSRVNEASANIAALKEEQSRGAFLIGRFYEKKRNYKSALIYYNDAIAKDPNSPFAEQSRQKVNELQELASLETKNKNTDLGGTQIFNLDE